MKTSYLSDDQIQQLDLGVKNNRDRLLIQLILYLGITLHELVNITKKDVDFENKTIIIRSELTKNKLKRKITIPDFFNFLFKKNN